MCQKRKKKKTGERLTKKKNAQRQTILIQSRSFYHKPLNGKKQNKNPEKTIHSVDFRIMFICIIQFDRAKNKSWYHEIKTYLNNNEKADNGDGGTKGKYSASC